MKTNVLVLLFIAAFSLTSCSVDNCDLDCNSGPLSLDFELLDKISGENLFTNGTFDPADIQILDLDNDNRSVQYVFIDEDEINILKLGPFGWETKIANYILKVGDKTIFKLHVDAEEKEEECCSLVVLNKLTLQGADYTQNTENGVYEVFVEI